MNQHMPPPQPPGSPGGPSVPAVRPQPPGVPVTFAGERADFRRLVMRGAFLELVTVGFYRFWLATDMRRHLWSSTAVDGDVLEYTGRARELLIGFLFALAILVPIYVAYFLIGLEAERYQAFASVPLGLFFYFFAQFAIYRARRYRLTRTVWRGVRFWMTGSGWGYALRAGAWALLVGVTLGLALPWREAALERYKMRHTSYGDLAGRFEGRGGAFFRQGWWLWLLIWPSLVVFPALPFVYGAFKAVEWRWWISGIRIGEVRFTSNLRNGALIGLYWKTIGWMCLASMFMSVWVSSAIGLAVAVYKDLHGGAALAPDAIPALLQQPAVLFGMGLGYLITMLGIGVVMRVYLTRDVWQRVAQSVTVQGLASADNVQAKGELASALGEGFADSLDVVGF